MVSSLNSVVRAVIRSIDPYVPEPAPFVTTILGLVAVVLCGIAFRKRAFVVGASSAILFISLPQVIAAVLPTPLSSWYVSAGVLWLLALAILGCLYLMREAETRTDTDIDARWLFRLQK